MDFPGVFHVFKDLFDDFPRLFLVFCFFSLWFGCYLEVFTLPLNFLFTIQKMAG